MSELNDTNLQQVLEEFKTASESILEWKWDGRFNTALAEFEIGKAEPVKKVLDTIFSETWETANIVGAPDNIKTIDYLFGSLMYGQLLLSSDPNQNVILYLCGGPGETVKQFQFELGIL